MNDIDYVKRVARNWLSEPGYHRMEPIVMGLLMYIHTLEGQLGKH